MRPATACRFRLGVPVARLISISLIRIAAGCGFERLSTEGGFVPRKRPFPQGSVCKPCWELKYCPYGQLVEYFPGPPVTRSPSQVQADYQEILSELTRATVKTEEEVWDLIERLHGRVPWIVEELRDYSPEDVGCRIFGHCCPVFLFRVAQPRRRRGGAKGGRSRAK
jgi:hypothetical protein